MCGDQQKTRLQKIVSSHSSGSAPRLDPFVRPSNRHNLRFLSDSNEVDGFYIHFYCLDIKVILDDTRNCALPRFLSRGLVQTPRDSRKLRKVDVGVEKSVNVALYQSELFTFSVVSCFDDVRAIAGRGSSQGCSAAFVITAK